MSVATGLAAKSAWSAQGRRTVLVLGGTGFLGPATVRCLLDRGHNVTLFNRGQSSPELFPSLERIRGNRDPKLQNLSALGGARRWDVVIDVWPQEPEIVEATATLLASRTDHYLYVSSVAAYDGYPHAGMDESSPIRLWNSAGEAYGINKAESERRLQTLVGSKLTLVRPGPIKGDRDGGPDLVTWLMRARSGGQHIGPGDGSDSVEFVDVKDVGSFLADCVDKQRLGAWNLTGQPMNFRTFLDHCKAITQSRGEFIWVPHSFLTNHGLKTDYELKMYAANFPFWRPEPQLSNIFRISSAKASGVGWRTRPITDTARDCMATFGVLLGNTSGWRDYLDPAREQAVLSDWIREKNAPTKS
jgi:2'-hydroxyisoflavone reductase